LNLFEAALSGSNIDKNRYQSVLPPDKTRVKLNSDEFGSDYINANFIDGIHNDSKQAYIATQAPKPDTIVDFWRMCWEQNVQIIVMLTNLEESGKVKAHQYWPKMGYKQYGEYGVTLQSQQDCEGFVIRTFEILQGFGGGLKPVDVDKRFIYQYHYQIWPDMGVPEDATSLLQMMDEINDINSNTQDEETKMNSPLLVHCSAGIGRTGTYILIDTVIKKFKEDGVNNTESLDLMPILSNMRDQRPGFVQQKTQYYFCYQSITQSVTGDKIPIKQKQSDEPEKRKERASKIFKRPSY